MQQWMAWFKKLAAKGQIKDQGVTHSDGNGVIFIMNCKDAAEARALIESLPLSKETLMDEQLIPVGPLLPLGILLRDSPANK